jgi:dTDP-4-amino-4,6-dideoxygalactose transaminase
LHLGLLALGVGPGDEVIVPSFTFAASANAVALTGARPIFADIEDTYYAISADLVEPLITSRTVAIMAVHLYGHPAPMNELVALCEKHGLALIEDAAQAHGATIDGKAVGSFGAFGAFSFYPTKNMTTGEGGMISTSDPALARATRLLRSQGMEERYVHEVVGLNERMTEVEAAIGRIQLGRLPAWVDARIANAAVLNEALKDHVGVPATAAGAKHVFHQYTVRSPERRAIMAALSEAEIGFGIYYPKGTHVQAPYAGSGAVVPVTERVTEEVLSIPVRPDLEPHELATIINVVKRAVSA